ncbi:MAG: DinB family protein [Phycisphaerales bacterium]|nr:DinB family protein [Phycisphaerales bacterium]
MDTLDRLIDHNAWANRALLDVARTLSAADLDRVFDIGPGSVRATLTHIVGAMHRWADRIGGRPLRDSIESNPTRPIDDLVAIHDVTATDLASIARRVRDEGRLDELFDVPISGFDAPFRFTRGTAITHVLTHGMHHRAQVRNMLRRLDVAFEPDLDVVEWELHLRGTSRSGD